MNVSVSKFRLHSDDDGTMIGLGISTERDTSGPISPEVEGLTSSEGVSMGDTCRVSWHNSSAVRCQVAQESHSLDS